MNADTARAEPTRWLTIIADDLTGAADTGAAFAAHGLETVVCLSLPVPPSLTADVLVLSTESRDRDAATAAAVTASVTAAALAWAGSRPVVYKKIDSTLRGHVQAEVAAVMRVLGVDGALVSPAFPDQQRTTVGGRQLLAGTPLEATSFAADVATSDLVVMFAAAGSPVHHVALAEVRGTEERLSRALDRARSGIVVVDAVSNDDLAAIARAAIAAGLQVLVGSAGLARAMAAIGPQTERARSAVTGGDTVDRAAGALVVAGSRHAATVAQVREAERGGLEVLRPSLSWLAGEGGPDAELVRRAVTGIRTGMPVVIATGDLTASPLGPAAIAGRLAEIARRVVLEEQPSLLVLTGGETAAAVCGALGSRLVRLTGELVPGIASGVLIDGLHRGLGVVTKAGGFGGPDALVRAVYRDSTR